MVRLVCQNSVPGVSSLSMGGCCFVSSAIRYHRFRRCTCNIGSSYIRCTSCSRISRVLEIMLHFNVLVVQDLNSSEITTVARYVPALLLTIYCLHCYQSSGWDASQTDGLAGIGRLLHLVDEPDPLRIHGYSNFDHSFATAFAGEQTLEDTTPGYSPISYSKATTLSD